MSGSKAWAVLGGSAIGVVVGLVLLLMALPILRHPKQASASPKARHRKAPAADVPAANAPQQSATEPAHAPEAASTAKTVSIQQLASLQEIIDNSVAELGGKSSVHLRFADGGEVGHEAEEERSAASVIKVPVMAALEHAWHSGTLQRTGIDEMRVRKAITESDNPSADGLIERVGMSQINTWLEEHSYTHTHLKHLLLGPRPEGPNVTSAADMTRMLLDISEGKLVDPAASAEMRKLLLASERRTRIPAGLPEGVPVGNKTGTLNGVVDDVAFVELPEGRKYALAILVEQARGDEPVSRAIADLSRKIYLALKPAGASSNPEP
jgi:beta-lactamase class A